MSVVAADESAEVKGRVRRRRRWLRQEKRHIVAETLQTSASVSIVARRHDANAN